MKRFLITICLFLSLFSGWGLSPINLGIKFGTNSSSLITDFNEFFDKSEIDHYLAGAFVRVNFGKLYIQPEAYFNTKGGNISSLNSIQNESADIPHVFSYQTIDIPIMVGIYILNKPLFNIRAHAGPVLSYVTASPLITDFTDLNINDFKDNYVGIQAGIGFDVWFLTIDARIEQSFNIFINGSNYLATNRVYLLSAGIKLF